MASSSDCPPELLSEIFSLLLEKPQRHFENLISTNDNYPALLPTQSSYEPYPFNPLVDITIIGGVRQTLDVSRTRLRQIIRQVCIYWRDTLDGDPRLWKEITYDGGESSDAFLHAISSSFPLPISVTVLFPNRSIHTQEIPTIHDELPTISRSSSTLILNVLSTAIDRVTELEITSSCSVEVAVVASFFSIFTRGQMLRSLGIHQMRECSAGELSEIPRLFLAKEMPLLVDFRLTCMPFPFAPAPLILKHVTSLDLHFDHETSAICGTWRSLNTFLSFAPNVTNLRITLSKNPRYALPFYGMKLPKLTHLTITLTETDNAHLILPTFYSPGISFLSLSYRNIFMTDGNSAQTFHHLMLPVSMTPHAPLIVSLTTLVLSWHTISELAILVIAHQLIHLENLVINNVGEPSMGPDRLLSYLLDSGIMLEFSRRRNIPYITPCLPRLKRVETHRTNRRRDQYFVHMRQRIGLPVILQGHYM